MISPPTMNLQNTKDFKRKNIFSIPCFYDSHLHLEGLGKYYLKKNLSHIDKKNLTDFLQSISFSKSNSKSNIHEAFGLKKEILQDLVSFETTLKQNLNIDSSLYWVLEDGHQLLVYGPLLEGFKAYIQKSGGTQNRPLGMQLENQHLGFFDDSTRSIFDTYYLNLTSKANKTQEHLLNAQSILLQAGITHCRDLTCNLEQFEILNQLALQNQYVLYTETFFSDFFGDDYLQLIKMSHEARALSHELASQNKERKEELGSLQEIDLHNFRIQHQGIKIFLDGTFSQGTADISCYSSCHHSSERKSSFSKYTSNEIEELLKHASLNSLDVAFHTMGDQAVLSVLKAFDNIKPHFQTRLHLEHCEVMNESTINFLLNLPPKFKRQLVFHFQPSHFLMDYDILKTISSKNLWIFPWSQLLQMGYQVHFGSDAPVTRPGLGYLKEKVFSSFFRNEHDYSLFWSTFVHPHYKKRPQTFTMFQDQDPVSVFINGQNISIEA